jgi:RHS repeat-associated protein
MVTAGGTYRLVEDHLGSVRRVVEEGSGVVAERIAYDAWGRVGMDTAPGAQPFGFAGGLSDASSGLVRFGRRDYDSRTGRWLNRDPSRFVGGSNHYTYADNDPIGESDPGGLYGQEWKPGQRGYCMPGDYCVAPDPDRRAHKGLRGAFGGLNLGPGGGGGFGGGGSGSGGSGGGFGICEDPPDDDGDYDHCKDLPIRERNLCCRDATSWRDEEPPSPTTVYRQSPAAWFEYLQQTNAYTNYEKCMGW